MRACLQDSRERRWILNRICLAARRNVAPLVKRQSQALPQAVFPILHYFTSSVVWLVSSYDPTHSLHTMRLDINRSLYETLEYPYPYSTNNILPAPSQIIIHHQNKSRSRLFPPPQHFGASQTVFGCGRAQVLSFPKCSQLQSSDSRFQSPPHLVISKWKILAAQRLPFPSSKSSWIVGNFLSSSKAVDDRWRWQSSTSSCIA